MKRYLAIGLTVFVVLISTVIGMNYLIFDHAGICVPDYKQRRTAAFSELEREIAIKQEKKWVDPTFEYRNAYFRLAKSLCPSAISDQDRHNAAKLGPTRQITVLWEDNPVEVKITVEADSVYINDIELVRSETEFTGQFEMEEFPVTVKYLFADGSTFSEPIELASKNDLESGDTIIESHRSWESRSPR